MKRVLLILLALAILSPALLLPASAVDPEEYVFEFFEKPSLYSEFPFYPDANIFVCDQFLPEGFYRFAIDPALYSVYGDFLITYNIPFNNNLNQCNLTIVVSIDTGNGVIQSPITLFVIPVQEDNITILSTNDPVPSGLQEIRLISCNTISSDINSFLFKTFNEEQFFDFQLIMNVILFSFGFVVFPVICWFGYRFVKRKLVKSFMKGKL